MVSKTVTRNDLKAVLDEVLPNASVDYIVEEGTSGNWTYRKWNSGIAECWGIHSFTFTSVATWGTYLGYSQPYANVDFPSGLFISVPTVTFARSSGTFEGWICSQNVTASGVVNMYLVRPPGTGNGSCAVSIQVKGKWK